MNGVSIIEHPLVQHYLTVLRDRRTSPDEFRRAMSQASALMGYEATRGLMVRSAPVRTPLRRAKGVRLQREMLLVPILRAGLGMLDGILPLLPRARVGFVGLKRQEKTLRAEEYYKSLPDDLGSFEILVLDPMLATGGSIVAALRLLDARGARRLRLMTLLAAPEGVERVRRARPDMPIFTAALDERLNEKGFIVPGLGDAGDRLFGV